MIVLLSEAIDSSTSDVCKILLDKNFVFTRINANDSLLFKDLVFESGEVSFSHTNDSIAVNFSAIASFWYRRGSFSFSKEYMLADDGNVFLLEALNNHNNKEYFKLEMFLYSEIAKIPIVLGNYLLSNPNKLYILEKAKRCNLLIPDTIVTTQKKTLQMFLQKHSKVVSKAINEAFLLETKKFTIFNYTIPFNKRILTQIPEYFFPTLFQEHIPKLFELRIFFIGNDFYPMAIFSQRDKKTKIDFRQYNFKEPNRNVPFKLPEIIKENLLILVQELNLNTGSIDMIYSCNKEYIFLEINPVGQYEMVSYPCNYYLNYKIVDFLTKRSEK